MEIVDFFLRNYGSISLIAATVFGVIIKFRRFIKNAIKSFILGDSFYNIYGENPAQAIKQVHEAIQNAHNTLEIRQSIAEKYLKIGVYICSTSGKCLWANEYLCEIFGLDSTEMKDFGWLSSIDTNDRKRVYENWIYAIHNKLSYSDDYNITNSRTMIKYNISTEAVAVVDDKNEIQCYVGYITIREQI